MDEGFESQPIRKRIKKSTENFERNSGWVKTRRLQRPEGLGLTDATASYVDLLPRFEKKTFLDHLYQLVDDKGKGKYLDIGGGTGLAALDLREIFPPEKLDIAVIGHQTDIEEGQYAHFGRYPLQPTKEKLEENNINFIHTDFLKAHKKLGSSSFDVVTACWSLNYIEYPPYAILKKVWRQLTPNGVAFIYPLSVGLVDTKTGDRLSFTEYLQDEFDLDIEARGGGISFRRTKPQLPNNLKQNIRYGDVELPK